MSEAKHTPGPWELASSGEVISTARPAPVGKYFAVVAWHGSDVHKIKAGDARLIASAPDLLAALKLVWSMFDDGRIVRNIANDRKPDWALKMLTFTRELQTIHAAISKATGEPILLSQELNK